MSRARRKATQRRSRAAFKSRAGRKENHVAFGGFFFGIRILDGPHGEEEVFDIQLPRWVTCSQRLSAAAFVLARVMVKHGMRQRPSDDGYPSLGEECVRCHARLPLVLYGMCELCYEKGSDEL